MYPTLTCRTDILRMLDEITDVRTKILDRCAKLPAEKIADPVFPGTWTILKNLTHLAWAERFMVSFMKSRPGAAAKDAIPPEAEQELGAVRSALDEAHAEAIAFLKSHPEEVLSEKCVFGRNLVETTVGGLYFHIIEHEIGHRAFILHKLKKLETV